MGNGKHPVVALDRSAPPAVGEVSGSRAGSRARRPTNDRSDSAFGSGIAVARAAKSEDVDLAMILRTRYP